MSKSILVIGESGSGKSTSIEKLNPDETFIIQVVGKDLPFKGWKSKYVKYDSTTKKGNYAILGTGSDIITFLKGISENLPQYKNIVIDDWQYTMSDEFMKRAREKGYEKFSEIAQNAYNVLKQTFALREDLNVFILSHSDTEEGKIVLKLIGRMLRDKITPEGLFTIVLLASKEQKKGGEIDHFFITNNGGESVAKSPKGMFELRIPNDLQLVIDKIKEYES